MGRLEYDSGAFAFFFLALWLAVLIPLTFSSIRHYLSSSKPPVLLGVPSEASYGKFVVRLAQKKNKALVATHAASLTSSKRFLSVVVLGWAVVLSYFLYQDTGGMSDIAHFDPFEILSISSGATEIQIKKAYKKLSLVYHPDRCEAKDKAGKALCETKFVMVAKAYEALTDPVAKENFQRYGNPDGRQAMEMSIGLPKWLLEPENQTWVIMSYLLLSIVVFPFSVMLLTSSAAKEGDKTVRRLYPDTEEIFRVGVRQGLTFIHCMELFCLSAEFRPFGFRNEEERKFLMELRNDLVREQRFQGPSKSLLYLLKQDKSLKTEGSDKMQILLVIHLYRLHTKLYGDHEENLLQDLEEMLTKSPVLLKALVSHARVTCHLHSVLSAISFQQCFNQAVIPGANHSLLQLPFSKNDVHTFQLDKQPLSLPLLLENRKKVETKSWLSSPKEEAEFDAVLNRFPFRELDSISVGTLKDELLTKGTHKKRQVKDIDFVFEEQSFQGDLVHVVVRLTAKHVRNQKRNVAFTPFLPHEVKEEWYAVLVGGPPPRGFVNIPSQREVKIVSFGLMEEDASSQLLVCDLPFGTGFNNNDWMNTSDFPVGSHQMGLFIFSSCYLDLELRREITLKLGDPKKLQKYVHHEEDKTLEKEGASLYSLLQPQADQNDQDSDFEDGNATNEDGEEED